MASGGKLVDHDNNDHYRACRLCQSTRRVLSIARFHAKQRHDRRNCKACRIWTVIKARCASLGLDISAVMDESNPDDGVAADAEDTSHPAVPFAGLGSSCK